LTRCPSSLRGTAPDEVPAVQELAVEKQEMRKAQRELKKQHMQLTRDKAAKERLLTDLDARAHDVQVRFLVPMTRSHVPGHCSSFGRLPELLHQCLYKSPPKNMNCYMRSGPTAQHCTAAAPGHSARMCGYCPW